MKIFVHTRVCLDRFTALSQKHTRTLILVHVQYVLSPQPLVLFQQSQYAFCSARVSRFILLVCGVVCSTPRSFQIRRPNLLDRRLAGELEHGAHISAAVVLSRSGRLP